MSTVRFGDFHQKGRDHFFQITEWSATWRRNTSSLIKMVLSLLVEILLVGRGSRGDDGQTEIRSCFGGNQDFPDAK